MDLKAKLYLVDDGGKFMGIGVLWLMKSIAREGSLRQAALELGISYSKAYLMIGNLERSLGYPVIYRRKGGIEHSGSSLTPLGVEFVRLYDSFQKRAKAQLEAPYLEFKDSLEKLLKEIEDEQKG